MWLVRVIGIAVLNASTNPYWQACILVPVVDTLVQHLHQIVAGEGGEWLREMHVIPRPFKLSVRRVVPPDGEIARPGICACRLLTLGHFHGRYLLSLVYQLVHPYSLIGIQALF